MRGIVRRANHIINRAVPGSVVRHDSMGPLGSVAFRLPVAQQPVGETMRQCGPWRRIARGDEAMERVNRMQHDDLQAVGDAMEFIKPTHRVCRERRLSRVRYGAA